MEHTHRWQDAWVTNIGSPPTRPSSREESVQEVLSNIIVGLSPACFLKYPPTPEGKRLLRAIRAAAFGDCPTEDIDWLVSEYALPVPDEWRDEIGLTYRSPDFVCGAANRILIIELKTEWGSYSNAQITDFLRLARRVHPDAALDLILIEERLRGVHRELDPEQRYAEMTWAQLAHLLRAELAGHDLACRLCDFLELSLPGATTAVPAAVAAEESASQADLVATAIDQALHIAPALEADPTNARLTRGIDVAFASDRDAREAEMAIREALRSAGHSGVSTWLWRKTSGGTPATPAGRDVGLELRIHPRR